MTTATTTTAAKPTPMTEERLARIAARRAHKHTVLCYGSYEPCGEHHVHTGPPNDPPERWCGGRNLDCNLRYDEDIADLVAEVRRLRDKFGDAARIW